MAMYGDLTEVKRQYSGMQGHRWKVEWSGTPQPVQIHLKCLRAVKDKLPKGQFILRISLCSGLGGHPLRWSNSQDEDWAGTTLPVHHDGNFYNIQLSFDQSIAAVLPSESDVQPEMVLIFELFLLCGIHSNIDRAVGWAAFPICNSELEILEGKYKCPLLRGHRDPKIDEFRKIDHLISSDIDHWLCNLYFQVIKLPKSLVGRKEYGVELQLPPHTPECSCTSEKNETDENVLGTDSGLKLVTSSPGQPLTSQRDPITHKGSIPTGVKEAEKGFHVVEGGEESKHKERARKKEEKILKCFHEEPATRNDFHRNGEEKANLNLKAQDSCGTNTGHEERFDGLVAANSESGMFLRAIRHNLLKLNTKDKCPNPVEKDRYPQVPSYEVDPDQYRFSVASNSSPVARTLAMHSRFVGRMFLEELGVSDWCSSEAWLIVLLVALNWFVRLYLHYCSQWLFLQAIGVPVNKFHFYPHTVELVYQNSLLHTCDELAIVALGPLTLNVAVLIMAMIRWVCHVLFGSFPSFLSRFIMAMGLWMVLDPLAIFIVDGILGRLAYSTDTPIADAAKLYWLFYRTQHSGIPGILITVILYTVTFVSSITILCFYFLRLHNRGKLLDVFYRLHSAEETFLVPLDLEMSNQELNYIIKKTEQWRGISGERRKVAVYDYIWNDELTVYPSRSCWPPRERRQTPGSEAGCGDVTSTRVSIHTIHPSGLPELYRHFLRLPDGAIVEVFGAISSAINAGGEVDTQIQRQVNNVDNALQSSTPSELRERQRSIYNAGRP
ncbi:uncharacterized protein ofcc1 isoform X2 [Scyliorhinus canicula]|uniref:uncharacterized protein ofcc1 isoform X2 n=1 Tax=Scyliorhinus canicula TaxID=7830 RepID=UPI0018F43E7C|nr:uncharacterized protein ofcc1 isoform X2 [Scyliorhinus canicula]